MTPQYMRNPVLNPSTFLCSCTKSSVIWYDSAPSSVTYDNILDTTNKQKLSLDLFWKWGLSKSRNRGNINYYSDISCDVKTFVYICSLLQYIWAGLYLGFQFRNSRRFSLALQSYQAGGIKISATPSSRASTPAPLALLIDCPHRHTERFVLVHLGRPAPRCTAASVCPGNIKHLSNEARPVRLSGRRQCGLHGNATHGEKRERWK